MLCKCLLIVVVETVGYQHFVVYLEVFAKFLEGCVESSWNFSGNVNKNVNKKPVFIG